MRQETITPQGRSSKHLTAEFLYTCLLCFSNLIIMLKNVLVDVNTEVNGLKKAFVLIFQQF